jgi:hypothetical protein
MGILRTVRDMHRPPPSTNTRSETDIKYRVHYDL